MASSGVNVLRWSALVFGVFYGFSHQQSINSREYTDKIKREYAHKQHLIDQAKAAFVKKNMPAGKKTEGSGTITDPMDPKFDLEAYLTLQEAGT